MKTKQADTPYCGVNEARIKQARPVLDPEVKQLLYQWISERYMIHLLKDVRHEPPPWTGDEVLQNYRFTNVRREHDRETRWVIRNICTNPVIDYDNKLLNTIVFRMYNKSFTMELLGGWIDFRWITEDQLQRWERLFDSQKESVYTNAFFVSGVVKGLKNHFNHVNQRVNPIRAVLQYQDRYNILSKINSAPNPDKVVAHLRELPGLGGFLSYQIFVDMTYIPEFPFSENEYTLCGPGCRRGLDRLFSDRDGMTYEECIFWVRDNQLEIFREFGYDPRELFSDLPEDERWLNVMSLQNVFCELSKYVKAKLGLGRPKVRYRTPSSSLY